MNDQTAALIAVVILGGLVVFQLSLALGSPLGEFAWGGAQRVLPRPLRVASVVATLIYAAAAIVILEAVNAIDLIGSVELTRTAVWVLAVFFAVGVPLNAISRSKRERVMALVALALSVLFVIVAL
jgi:hypothetical protein